MAKYLPLFSISRINTGKYFMLYTVISDEKLTSIPRLTDIVNTLVIKEMALNESISFWKEILDKMKPLSDVECAPWLHPCCIRWRWMKHECAGCPIYEYTGRTQCYDIIPKATEKSSHALKVPKKLIRRELKFLQKVYIEVLQDYCLALKNLSDAFMEL